MKFFKWFAGFFEDQKGSASSKRMTLYGSMYFMYMMVKASLEGVKVDFNLLIVVSGIILVCLGVVTAEFFNKIENKQV